jgi:hypothetical protein
MGRHTPGRGRCRMRARVLELEDGDREKVAGKLMRQAGRDWRSKRASERGSVWREHVWSLRALEGGIVTPKTLEIEGLAERLQRNSGIASADYTVLARLPVRTRIVASPAGLEPATLCLEGRCSIHLSYGLSYVFDFNSAVASFALH